MPGTDYAVGSGERRLHDYPHPIGPMAGARRYIGRAAHSPGRPLAGRTVFRFSRAEHSALRRSSGIRRRPRLDRQHLVAATRRRPGAGRAHHHARRLFLVLLLSRARVVARGNSFAEPGPRLRAVPRQPHLVVGTRVHREPVSPALGTMGSLPVGDRRPFFFLAYRFDNRFVLSLALSSLAGWFGLTISHWTSHQDEAYRRYAILYSLIVGGPERRFSASA